MVQLQAIDELKERDKEDILQLIDGWLNKTMNDKKKTLWKETWNSYFRQKGFIRPKIKIQFDSVRRCDLICIWSDVNEEEQTSKGLCSDN